MTSHGRHLLHALARHTWLTALEPSSHWAPPHARTTVAGKRRTGQTHCTVRSLTSHQTTACTKCTPHVGVAVRCPVRVQVAHRFPHSYSHIEHAEICQRRHPARNASSTRSFATSEVKPDAAHSKSDQAITPPSLHLDDSRAHLQAVLQRFPPLQWSCAYGSGVIRQRGYKAGEKPLIDMLFVVDDAERWHRENLQSCNNQSHYSWLARLLGVKAIAAIQRNYGAGVWFHTGIQVDQTSIKYGVVELSTTQSDLHHWTTLYIAGRLHKPVLILRDETNGVFEKEMYHNCRSALVTALLLLLTSRPPTPTPTATAPLVITDDSLFHSIAQLSYTGDIRMSLKAENPHKVSNIVHHNIAAFRELYQPHIDWLQQQHILTFEQHQLKVQPTASTLDSLIQHLPTNIAKHITDAANHDASQLHAAIQSALRHIVQRPSFGQSAKGIITAGPLSAVLYALRKLYKSITASR